MKRKKLAKLRQAVADYMFSEGCGCCSDRDGHTQHTKQLAELLDVPMYADKSGYAFAGFRTDANKNSE